MPLWSFPGTVTDHTNDPGLFLGELDLGCKWYLPTPIRVAGLGARSKLRIPDLLPVGARFLAYTNRLDQQHPVRAHIVLPDGRDLAATAKGTKQPAPLVADYGGTLNKVWRYPATVVRARDGDTADVRVDLATRCRYLNGIRIQHVDAPEHGTAEGDAATVWAERVLTPGLPVTVTSHVLEKYGRILGAVTLPDGADYGQALITAGHAQPYEGGRR